LNDFDKRLPKVAVLLAAYNGVGFLEEQVGSILAQEGVNVTLFVSVDASTDGTEEWFNRLQQREARVVLLPHGQVFGGAAKNFFRLINEVDLSGCDYMAFADQDDLWFSDKLARAHLVMAAAGADAYSSNIIAFWPSGRKLLIDKSQPQKRWDFLFEAAGPGCTYVMKLNLAKALQKVSRERWHEIQKVALHDWFFYAYARANGYEWVIDNHFGMMYRQHGANQVGANAGWAAFMHRVRKVLSGWALGQAALIARLVDVDEDPFVRRWLVKDGRGLFWLMLHSHQCRRRPRDSVFFALSCMILGISGMLRR
jgi:rhamnosyltransferase